MQTINLTDAIDGNTVRINTDHIVAYGPDQDGGSLILLSNLSATNGSFEVKESAEEIDKLLSELP